MASSEAWSASEAKARSSELRHLLRQGKTIRVTDHGERVPQERPFAATNGIEGRVERLRGRGIL